MVIPLMKQAADEVGRDDHAKLRYAAAWGPSRPHAAEARRDVRAVLAHAPHGDRPTVPASRLMDAELVVSELITNALRHAPGPCALTLRLTGTELTISLYDTSPDAPVVQPPDRRRVGGHGLYLVHSVSDRVVVTPGAAARRSPPICGLPRVTPPAARTPPAGMAASLYGRVRTASSADRSTRRDGAAHAPGATARSPRSAHRSARPRSARQGGVSRMVTSGARRPARRASRTTRRRRCRARRESRATGRVRAPRSRHPDP